MTNSSQQSEASEDQFELVLRIQQSRGSHPTDGAADLRSRAQALVRDTLMSRLEVDPEMGANDYVHTRGFSDLGKALAASRALQMAFEGFRSAIPSGRASISMVLDSSAPGEALPSYAGPSVEQKDVLDSAKPSQVLVTQAFYDRVAQYQPALRSFPRRAGVYEFLWTSEDRLNELQAEADFMPTLVIDPSPAAAPTNPTIFDQPMPARTEVQPAEGTWRPRQQRISEPDDRESAPARSRGRMIAMISLVVVLISLGIGYLVISHTPAARRPGVAAQSPAPVTPTPAANIPPTPQDESQPTVPPSPTPAPGDNKSRPATPAHPTPGGDRSSVTPPSDGSKPARVHECSISGLIPNYLRLAENNRIRGQFEAAIRQYTAVLGCEPGNREARDGLQRTRDAERLGH